MHLYRVLLESEIFQMLLHGPWHEIFPLRLLQPRNILHHLLIVPALVLNTLVLVPLFKIIYNFIFICIYLYIYYIYALVLNTFVLVSLFVLELICF